MVSGRPIYVVGSDGDGGVTRVGGGRLATRPPAGHYGRVYLVIEAEGLYWTRDNSTAWETVGASEGAASILAKLLTVDGTGSGLDADLLDGLNANAFVGANDPRVPTQGENDALQGTSGIPAGTNRYVTNDDSRNANARTPTTHNASHVTGGSDPLTPANIGAVSKAGDSGVTPFTLTRDPNQALEPATMQYVDAARAGLDLKQSVRGATTANVDLATGGLLTVDGVGLAAGDRVLVKDQTTTSNNGIYLAASGTWGRAPDADSGPEVTPNAFVFVEEGSGNQDTGWVVSTNGPITLGTTAITWTQFSGPGAVTAGAGLARTGNQLSVASAGIVAAMLAAALKDGAATDATMRSLGTGASQAAAGNDGRLSDTRTPTDGSVTRAKMSQTNRGLIICTSTTRPTGTDAPEGQHIYETDTDATLKNTGTPTAPVWSALGGGSGGGYVSPAHIAGLALRWDSGSALSVESGGAYVPSKGGVLDVTSTLSLTGLTFTANTWYYAYLFDNAGTPVLELSTVAPAAPYRGTARVRGGGTAADSARRFLGAVKSNAEATPRMLRWLMQGNAWFWQEPTNAAPFRILLGGTATTETTLDLSPVVPLNARSATMNAANTSTDRNANFSSADVSGVLLAVRTDKQVAAALGTTANQTVSYFYPTAPTSGSFTVDVLAFGFAR
ncbi:MAG: hypothetical protein M3P49_08190 [Actinomycetota bacterium]|nr:hypothetical protein [Actinomycetota bacterium]